MNKRMSEYWETLKKVIREHRGISIAIGGLCGVWIISEKSGIGVAAIVGFLGLLLGALIAGVLQALKKKHHKNKEKR